MLSEGSIHGRFQPFHNEHLESALAAFDRCVFLWIGLTEPFPAEPSVDGPEHHSARSANPLTYYERQFMVTRTLVAEGIEPERFSFTPFPIRNPELLPQFLDPEITCFTTVNDDWARKKNELLTEHGYSVEILWERDRDTTSAAVRDLILADDPAWRDLVPSSVASYLDELDLSTRLRSLEG